MQVNAPTQHISGLKTAADGRAFNVRRSNGPTLSAGSLNHVDYHQLQNRAAILSLLAWDDTNDATLFEATTGVPEALRLMADFLDAADDVAAPTLLRNASRRKGLMQVRQRPEA